MTTLPRPTPAPLALAGFLAAVTAVAVVGSLAATRSRAIYSGLTQPPWAPPSWLFGPVWTVLYLLIAVSGWLFWRAGGTRREFLWYAAGLVLNAAWTPLFFAAGAYTLALVEIVVLDVVIAGTLLVFRRRSKTATALQLPYLAWTLFATALNAAIVVLNP
ncbi:MULTISPECIES: TspO/MBR family protein [unclassified Amycolatopsis]|uniref:TspO/MBR family protein n=1 Tax=unclassified Amycolatopsis TaxID=2618356 RepID=UPI002874473E|nr:MULTISPECIES: TspO/MBR family protein [unclassified Amycolatopsis]MDS0134554.1 tryptophan-rich sensory protein [Amycolatopsis sp. 505]MDS0147902.1 tryptophan-rich sensory protein [Amycolatopsis sp. CM201R]